MTTFDEIDRALSEQELSPEQQLAQAKEVIAGPVPLIDNPVSPLVVLPRGVLKGQDWHSDAFIRELNGEDEEALARFKDIVEYYDHVLARAVEQIGAIDLKSLPMSERQTMVQNLLVGERSMLLLAIIRITYGDEKLLNVTCNTCQTEQEVALILSEDLKAKEMKDPRKMVYTYTTSKGDSIEYRLATGADQLEATRRKGASQPEQNSIVLSRCITKVNGQLILDPLKYARSLTMKERRELLTALVENQPMVDLTVVTNCVSCGEELRLPLGWGDLFQP